jgi:hypothetical protein
MNLVQRVKNILLTPKTEWPAVAAETTPDAQVIVGYVLPLAAVAAIAGFIGMSLVGMGMGMFGTVRIGIGWGLASAIYHVVMAVVMVYVLAFIIDALAPTFGAEKGFSRALKVAAYAYTPVWVVSIVTILPMLGILVLLAALYAIYLLYLGLAPVMRAPAEKSAGYTAVVVIAGIVLWVVIGTIGGLVIGAGAGAGMMGLGGAGAPPATFDRGSSMGKLEEFNRRMEEADRRMDEAQKSGDPNKQMEAALGALGTALSGGQGVEPVQVDQIKTFVPEQFAGLPRTAMSTDRSGVKGLMVAKAAGTYADAEGRKRVELEVTDTGGAAGLLALAGWMGVQGEHEDAQRKEVTREEGGRLVHEEVRKNGGPSEYTVVLAKRFVVSAKGEGIDLDTLRSGVNGLDLGKLASLE